MFCADLATRHGPAWPARSRHGPGDPACGRGTSPGPGLAPFDPAQVRPALAPTEPGEPIPPLVPQAAGDRSSLRLLRRVGRVDPGSLDSYRAEGGYEMLRRAVQAGPQGVIRELKDAKLLVSRE
jgi:NADH-quinone oxidoreductase subunit F